jgi:hypothetical protein
LRPQVLIHEAGVPRRHAIIVDLGHQADLKIDRSLRVQDCNVEQIDYLLPRRKLNWMHMSSE